jgi:DNA-directed RNA polymerase subunit RPC12/RpoP
METRTKKNVTPVSAEPVFINVCAHCGRGLTADDQWRIDCADCGYDLDWTPRRTKTPPPPGRRVDSLRLIIAKLDACKSLTIAEMCVVDEIRDQYAATLRWQGILAHITEMIGSSGFVSEHASQTKAAIELNVFPSEADRYWNTLMAIGACAIEHYCYIEIRPANAQRFEIRRLS